MDFGAKLCVMVLLLSGLKTPAAHAASFDCTRAHLRVEYMVCSNPELSALDDRLGAIFERAFQAANQAVQRGLTSSEAQWLGQRDRCDDAICVTHTYRERIAEIRNAYFRPNQVAQDGPMGPRYGTAAPGAAAKPDASSLIDHRGDRRLAQEVHPKPKPLMQEAERRQKAAAEAARFEVEYGVVWSSASKVDQMSDDKILTAGSLQKSSDGQVEAEVTIACHTANKGLEIDALFVDSHGNGVHLLDSSGDLVTIEIRLGDDAPQASQPQPKTTAINCSYRQRCLPHS